MIGMRKLYYFAIAGGAKKMERVTREIQVPVYDDRGFRIGTAAGVVLKVRVDADEGEWETFQELTPELAKESWPIVIEVSPELWERWLAVKAEYDGMRRALSTLSLQERARREKERRQRLGGSAS